MKLQPSALPYQRVWRIIFSKISVTVSPNCYSCHFPSYSMSLWPTTVLHRSKNQFHCTLFLTLPFQLMFSLHRSPSTKFNGQPLYLLPTTNWWSICFVGYVSSILSTCPVHINPFILINFLTSGCPQRHQSSALCHLWQTSLSTTLL